MRVSQTGSGLGGVDGGIDRDEGRSGNFLKSEEEDLNDGGEWWRIFLGRTWVN